jgi:ribosomal protein L25 (general stress protein Ctc)
MNAISSPLRLFKSANNKIYSGRRSAIINISFALVAFASFLRHICYAFDFILVVAFLNLFQILPRAIFLHRTKKHNDWHDNAQ